jgi:hypothetical protein
MKRLPKRARQAAIAGYPNNPRSDTDLLPFYTRPIVECTPLDRTRGGLGREHDVFPGER